MMAMALLLLFEITSSWWFMLVHAGAKLAQHFSDCRGCEAYVVMDVISVVLLSRRCCCEACVRSPLLGILCPAHVNVADPLEGGLVTCTVLAHARSAKFINPSS